MQEPIFSDAPVSVEPSNISTYVIPSLLSVPMFRPIIRGTDDTRHLAVIATFARECGPSEMVVDALSIGHTVTFYGADRYRMAVYLFRYLCAEGLARVAWRMPSARPHCCRATFRDGAEVAAFIGKTYVFIGL